ncbi:kinesin-related protein 4-like [Mercenaria mercenaria]|uniref:kinesin-related protein 4-like n=1 Tax=Mercenaria mercenaria TaxID=6596 RepID=UPI00234FA1A6|nr:kinesin-related protein 4-like [Mercenaria mercenaria]
MDIVQLDQHTSLSPWKRRGDYAALDKGALINIVQSFGILLSRCEEAAGAAAAAADHQLPMSGDEETTPVMPRFRRVRRVLEYESSPERDDGADDEHSADDDEGIFVTQRFPDDTDTASEHSIQYAREEDGQHWFTDGEDSDDDINSDVMHVDDVIDLTGGSYNNDDGNEDDDDEPTADFTVANTVDFSESFDENDYFLQ